MYYLLADLPLSFYPMCGAWLVRAWLNILQGSHVDPSLISARTIFEGAGDLLRVTAACIICCLPLLLVALIVMGVVRGRAVCSVASHTERGSTPGMADHVPRGGRGGLPFPRSGRRVLPAAVPAPAMGFRDGRGDRGRIYAFPEVRQRRFVQANDFMGKDRADWTCWRRRWG